jgi:hypothetical protein
MFSGSIHLLANDKISFKYYFSLSDCVNQEGPENVLEVEIKDLEVTFENRKHFLQAVHKSLACGQLHKNHNILLAKVF